MKSTRQQQLGHGGSLLLSVTTHPPVGQTGRHQGNQQPRPSSSSSTSHGGSAVEGLQHGLTGGSEAGGRAGGREQGLGGVAAAAVYGIMMSNILEMMIIDLYTATSSREGGDKQHPSPSVVGLLWHRERAAPHKQRAPASGRVVVFMTDGGLTSNTSRRGSSSSSR